MSKVPYTLSENSLTIFWEGKPYTIRKDHANFQLAKKAIMDGRYDELGDLIDIVKSVENFVEGDIEVKDEVVYYKGHRLHGVVVDRLIEMLRAGMKDSAPLVNFITRLQANPSANSVSELYSFMSYKLLPNTPEGKVLGYKGVQGDYWSSTGNADTLVLQGKTNERHQILNEVGIQYLDSPVSGLKFRAEEGALVSMVSGAASELKKARKLLEGYSRAVVHVGTEPGQGQRMKVLNNAICIASYVISSEALTYGEAGGLKVGEMLEVINESSGQNFATKFLFPKYVATEQYDASGAEAHIIEKDISLFVEGANGDGTPSKVIAAAYEIIKAFNDADPLQDQMNIYPYVKGLHKN